MNIRPIAIYLPQYHPIKENDEWWGTGFTEWINVVKSKPLFKGHYQPHLPADLGFYDLRVPEVREQQAQLAKESGIYGFCYYHYWFNGRRILERPFEEVIKSNKPDFPFMLCWANENWTRSWDGNSNEILLKQNYSEKDDREHIKKLLEYFADPRYIRIDNKPVIAIYRSSLLPNSKQTTDIWRDEARKENTELYICRFENFGDIGSSYIQDGGFDAAIDFPPFGRGFEKFIDERMTNAKNNLIKRILAKIFKTSFNILNTELCKKYLYKKYNVYDYSEYVNFITKLEYPSNSFFPGITPMWDNYPRKKSSYKIFKNSSPELYEKWLKHLVSKFKPSSSEENLIFINAWNEWAEGNHLEPCIKYGKEYLNATKKVLCNAKGFRYNSQL